MATSRPMLPLQTRGDPLFLPEDGRRESSGPEEVEVEEFRAALDTPMPAESDEAEDELVENEDGSVTITSGEDEEGAESGDFLENLVAARPRGTFDSVSRQLLELVEQDRKDREQRDKQYAEGIKRTGLGDEAPGGAQFQGASRAVHPVLIEACIDFSARAMKELFPAKGPVRTHIIGKQTDAKLEKAERKRQFMNWQLTKGIPSYRAELEQLLTQVPLGGSQYMKLWPNHERKRPEAEFVPIDDIVVPYSCSDFYAAERLTHILHLTASKYEERVQQGLYVDVRSSSGGLMPEESAAAQASARIEGKDSSAFNIDGVRDFYEVQVFLDLEGEDPEAPKGRKVPYILTITDEGHPLGLYRNWNPEKEHYDKKHCIVEFPFLPWRGAYAVGLGQAAGSLAGAATGALRALLDSAHTQNFPGGLRLKGARMAGQNVRVQPGELAEIEGPANVDDIRKLAMAFPYPGPSTVLFELMKFCVDAAKGLVQTADDRIAEASPNAPVGTTLALIEQQSVTFSAVHARLHDAQRRCLEIIHEINGGILSDEETIEELGELVVSRKDFQGPMDVQPVSDPNIFSDSQRYAQQQAVLQLRQLFPGGLKDNVLLERTLKLMNYPDWEEVLNQPASPELRDPWDENVAARDPLKAIKVYDENDDIEHLKIHISYLTSPVFCANPLMAAPAMPKLIQHCSEHITALYAKHIKAAIKAAEVTGLTEAPGDTPATVGARMAERELITELQQMLPPLMQAMEQAKQLVPPPPKDPAVQVAEMRAQAEQAKAQVAGQTKQAEVQARAQEQVAAEQAETQRLQLQESSETQRLNLEKQWEQTIRAMEQRHEALLKRNEDAINARNVEIAEQSEQMARVVQERMNQVNNEVKLLMQERDQQFERMMTMLSAALESRQRQEDASNTAAQSQLDSGLRQGEQNASND